MMRAAFLLSLLLALPAEAGNDSAYSDLNIETCAEVEPAPPPGEGEGSAVYDCKGFKTWRVTFAEDDLRSFLAFGRDGRTHCGFRQTFSGFNSVGKKVEWRLKNGTPIASILRWSVSMDSENAEKQTSWLVVTKLEDRDSCHMGYVEGGYPNANDKARWIADTAAEAFSCAKGIPIVFANPGTVTENMSTAGGCAP